MHPAIKSLMGGGYSHGASTVPRTSSKIQFRISGFYSASCVLAAHNPSSMRGWRAGGERTIYAQDNAHDKLPSPV